MAGMPPYQFIPPGHPAGAWAQAMMVQQQAQLAAQAQAQAVAQAQAAQAAAYARQMVQPVAAPTGPMQMPGGPGHSQPVQTGKITRKSFLSKLCRLFANFCRNPFICGQNRVQFLSILPKKYNLPKSFTTQKTFKKPHELLNRHQKSKN
jgi:hypothetical protein